MKYIIFLTLLYGCSSERNVFSDDKVYIFIDGKQIEIVLDEYENPYLKQKTTCGIMYVPFTFPIEDEEIPRVYEVKTQ